MIFRNLTAAAAALSATAVLSLGVATPARAAGPLPGTIHLTLTAEGPILGDSDNVIYNAHITNTGTETATGVVVHVTGWFCENGEWSLAACHMLPDAFDPAKLMSYDVPLDALAAGDRDGFPVTAWLPNEDSGQVRVTMEVVRSDQRDTNSVPGTCQSGWNQQDDCDSAVYDLS